MVEAVWVALKNLSKVDLEEILTWDKTAFDSTEEQASKAVSQAIEASKATRAEELLADAIARWDNQRNQFQWWQSTKIITT